ncbi:homoserine dehydrogenase [Pseudohyphozyma bogoriensis]|nr:homoserine dehydrogenase [Pseudohyphozyma bogoriensis]
MYPPHVQPSSYYHDPQQYPPYAPPHGETYFNHDLLMPGWGGDTTTMYSSPGHSSDGPGDFEQLPSLELYDADTEQLNNEMNAKVAEWGGKRHELQDQIRKLIEASEPVEGQPRVGRPRAESFSLSTYPMVVNIAILGVGGIEAFITSLASSCTPTILIDNTATSTVPSLYPLALSSGLSIVTPNKKGFASSHGLWSSIQTSLSQPGAGLLYHEGTVGAGLPIICTLKDLLRTGDEVTRIEGVTSGTLSYLFNEFSTVDGKDGRTFSEIVDVARREGFTEPQPADDLTGADVARKFTILARIISPLSPSSTLPPLPDGHLSVPTQSLIPPSLSSQTFSSGEEFVEKLRAFDVEWEEKDEEARREGKVWRYVGVVDCVKGEVKCGLEKYPPTHPFVSPTGGSQQVVAFYTKRYATSPLVIQGATDGAELTAMAVVADVLRTFFGDDDSTDTFTTERPRPPTKRQSSSLPAHSHSPPAVETAAAGGSSPQSSLTSLSDHESEDDGFPTSDPGPSARAGGATATATITKVKLKRPIVRSPSLYGDEEASPADPSASPGKRAYEFGNRQLVQPRKRGAVARDDDGRESSASSEGVLVQRGPAKKLKRKAEDALPTTTSSKHKSTSSTSSSNPKPASKLSSTESKPSASTSTKPAPPKLPSSRPLPSAPGSTPKPSASTSISTSTKPVTTGSSKMNPALMPGKPSPFMKKPMAPKPAQGIPNSSSSSKIASLIRKKPTQATPKKEEPVVPKPPPKPVQEFKSKEQLEAELQAERKREEEEVAGYGKNAKDLLWQSRTMKAFEDTLRQGVRDKANAHRNKYGYSVPQLPRLSTYGSVFSLWPRSGKVKGRDSEGKIVYWAEGEKEAMEAEDERKRRENMEEGEVDVGTGGGFASGSGSGSGLGRELKMDVDV